MTDMRYEELYSILKKHGWTLIRDHGTHRIFENREGRRERLALGGDQTMGGGGLKEIFKRFQLPYQLDGGKQPTKAAMQEAKAKRARAKPGEVLAAPGTFGRRLFDARVAKGLSQSKLGPMVGSNQMNISGWERGVSSPITEDGRIRYAKQAPVIYKIAELFGWEDMKAKASSTTVKLNQVVEAVLAPPPPRVEIITRPVGVTPHFNPDAATRLGHDARDFVALIRPKDVMQAMEDMEKRIAQLEAELKHVYTTELGSAKRKADRYDLLVGKLNDVMNEEIENTP